MPVPLIEQTQRVRLPNGKVKLVNRFDFNLAYAAWKGGGVIPRYIQLTDGSWIRIDRLT